MTLEKQVLKLVVDQFCRRVVVALYLVADDLHLLVNLHLRILAVEDDIRQQFDGQTEVVAVDGGIKRGIFLIGKSVELAAHTLQGVDNLQGVALTGALEGHVLAEVGQSLLAGGLVARAGGNLIAAIHHRRRRRQMNHAEAVGQG